MKDALSGTVSWAFSACYSFQLIVAASGELFFIHLFKTITRPGQGYSPASPPAPYPLTPVVLM
jgi:hypothetical protein